MSKEITWERTKRPAEELWYELNWAKFLGEVTIAISNWSLVTEESGLEIAATAVADDNRHALVRLAGGETGEVWLANTIVTSEGETLERAVRLTIE